MENNIPTAEEYFDQRYSELGIRHADEINREDVRIAKELIRIHVQAALTAAHKNMQLPEEDIDFTLNAYPLENIK